MGKPITTYKGAQYTLEFTATEKVNGVVSVSNITGATPTFYVYDNVTNQRLIFEAECTVTNAAQGLFEFLLTDEMTKEAGSFTYEIWATYSNGNNVPWGTGIFKIEA